MCFASFVYALTEVSCGCPNIYEIFLYWQLTSPIPGSSFLASSFYSLTRFLHPAVGSFSTIFLHTSCYGLLNIILDWYIQGKKTKQNQNPFLKFPEKWIYVDELIFRCFQENPEHRNLECCTPILITFVRISLIYPTTLVQWTHIFVMFIYN